MDHLALLALSSLLLWFGRVILHQLAQHVHKNKWDIYIIIGFFLVVILRKIIFFIILE